MLALSTSCLSSSFNNRPSGSVSILVFTVPIAVLVPDAKMGTTLLFVAPPFTSGPY